MVQIRWAGIMHPSSHFNDISHSMLFRPQPNKQFKFGVKLCDFSWEKEKNHFAEASGGEIKNLVTPHDHPWLFNSAKTTKVRCEYKSEGYRRIMPLAKTLS